MEIREAGLRDVFKIDEIRVDDRRKFDNPLFLKGAPPPYPTWRGWKRFFKFLSLWINPRSRLFFLLEKGKVAGVAVIVRGNYIDGFYINPEYRRQGMGKKLMEHVLAYIAEGDQEAEVRVEDRNREALEFYRSCSFQEKARILSKRLVGGRER
jgi:ribosomal protein S18 acetylase RimI-like enzyme